ncbi:Oidioi.mRNA.OKI2018_I69.chr1.g1927.t1.cds [Oikopleura dioica]|uniref:Oidioi.mRNA.OKI2018_I69.chr1.g1927.t1.cds n=1 Tax=Oikopleura dioica TaxID=34765 RepID=A0ABN7SUS1_OIKDI|nr:Oidioi.mRNA.OKI2018_I69.chr1.g1927.t1.cds [Oikopleura dioica]
MYPNTAPPQYQQQQPYPAAPFAGAPGYGAPPPPPAPAPAMAPQPPPAPSTHQPMVINIQQNAPPPSLSSPPPVQQALSQQALPQQIQVPVQASERNAPTPPFPVFNDAQFHNIDGMVVEESIPLCDGPLEYTVFTFIDVPLGAYGNNAYVGAIHCCHKIMSNSSEGLTFEFVEFATELGYDFVYLQGENGVQYYFSGPETRGSFNGMRLSTIYSPMKLCFKSDEKNGDTGFKIRAINGYEPWNDIDNNWPDKVNT